MRRSSLTSSSNINNSKTSFSREKTSNIPAMDRSATYVVEEKQKTGVSKATSEYTIPRIDSPKTMGSSSNNQTNKFTSKIVPPKIRSSTFSSTTRYMNNNNQSSNDIVSVSDENKSSQEMSSPTSKKTTTSLALLKQQRKAELLKSSASNQNNKNNSNSKSFDDHVAIFNNNPKSLELILKHARKSGQLNLSDFGLEEVPKNVWLMNQEKPPIDSSLSMDDQTDESFKWWDQIELAKLILASNKIKNISKEIKQLYSLTALDLHNNELTNIDEAIGDLNLLQTLNLSHNQLRTLPNNISKLKSLIWLNCSNNKLDQLPRNIGHLDDLEFLDFSNNSITSIPPSFGWLTKLRHLDLSKNSIKKLIPEMFYSITLKMIDISENQLEVLPKEVGDLVNLEQFFSRHNKLKYFPYLEKCHKLKDWDMSFNQIIEIDQKSFDNLVSLVNLNLRDNQIGVLPSSVKLLQNIERLDLSNNNLSALPCELATIESLKQILLTGNPLRSIRKDIIARGTESIMRYLQNQITVSQDESNNSENSLLKSPEIVKSTKVFDLGAKKLTEITPDMITFCKQCTALSFNASRNFLKDLPNEMEILNNQLHELNLSFNMFKTLPKSMFGLINLTILDLRNNQLEDIPNEISKLKALRELIIADNRLIQIPPGIYDLPILENLFANNNKIRIIDANGIIQMKHLNTLNLQNNDIESVPPLLGKAQQLRSLQLEGNPFRIPRPQIIQKGTDAILEHLRGRLTEL